jgi:glyoxylase-like metal-dependent hydrolase (beta-lactamase superfamily II)
MKNSRRFDHPVRKLCDGVYLIDEFGATNCYLLVGQKRALLIDTGNGFGDMKRVVSSITSLPLDVALTHGHIDHAGGYAQFPFVYLHPADDTDMLRFQVAKSFRAVSAKMTSASKMGITGRDLQHGGYPLKTAPLENNRVFDLGGKTVRVEYAPGHSKGSVIFIAEEDKLIFTGDNVCPVLWMFVPGGTSVEEWLPTAKRIAELAQTYTVCPAHYTVPQKPEEIRALAECGERLLSNTKRNSLFYRVRSYPQTGDIRIVYRTDKVFKDKTSTD